MTKYNTASTRDLEMGEGNREAARNYNRAATRKASDTASVEVAARDAAQALDGPEAGELRAAEFEGKRAVEGEEPGQEPLATISPKLRDLDPDVRRKALERANEFMAQGYDNRRAMRMGTVLAVEWAENGKSDDRGPYGPAQHVMFEDRHWVVVDEDHKEAVATFNAMEDAMRKAHERATQLASAVFVHGPDGELIDKFDGYQKAAEEKPYHVIPRDDGWALTRLGVEEEYETFSVKRDAIDRGRVLAREASSKLVIHYQNGAVARTHSYA